MHQRGLRWLAVVGLTVILTGCAGLTDVVSTGPDTYKISAQGTMSLFSCGTPNAKALQQATAFCRKQGDLMMPIKSDEATVGPREIAGGELEFRCVKPVAPTPQRPAS